MAAVRGSYKKLVDRWLEIPDSFGKSLLEDTFMSLLWGALGVGINLRKGTAINNPKTPGGGLKPDYLIYRDPAAPPVLVVEDKKRVPELVKVPELQFAEACMQHPLYRSAVGYEGDKGENGICQYLNKDRVDSQFLASYGLVFNGDFFQLWRRVDGLVFPLTPIQKVTKASLPGLIKQLEYCLENPQPAIILSVWNQKGGVAKTTNIINIAATLSLVGKRVLLIDLDPQGDMTRGIGAVSSYSPGILYKCLQKVQLEEEEEAIELVRSSIQGCNFPTSSNQSYRLSILSEDAEALKKLRDSSDILSWNLFPKLVKLLQRDYDYVFLDVSPTPDNLLKCVLLSCDAVLIPIDLGNKSLHHAINIYRRTIPGFRSHRLAKQGKMHLGPWNLGLVFSNCPSDAGIQLERCIEKELQSQGFTGKQYKTKLRTFAQAKIAEFKHMPVVSWQNSPITKRYSDLVNELFLTHNFIDH